MDILRSHLLSLFGLLLLIFRDACSTSNLAYNKPATQSGTYNGQGASQAVDSDTTNTCAFSDNGGGGPPTWWQVDLLYQSYITNVTIQFPNNDESEYMQGFVIIVSDKTSTSSSTPLCYTFSNGSDTSSGDTVTLRGLRPTFTCNQPLIGRYVTIRRQGGYQTRFMSLCDVQVIGTVTDSVDRAHEQPAVQCNVTWINNIAGYAVDGDPNTCANADTRYTGVTPPGWWQVDLQDLYSISSINILASSIQWNANYMQGFNIYVSNSSNTDNLLSSDICSSYNTTADIVPGRLFNLNCSREILGRYVTYRRTIGSLATALTLCEVNVIGRYIKTQKLTPLAV